MLVTDPQLLSVCSIVALVAALPYISVYVLVAQRQLLRRLFSSFDVVFLSIQLTLAHLCIADLFFWDTRLLAVASSWMWMHWVLLLDAVTPTHRQALGHVAAFPVFVVCAFVVVQLIIGIELIFIDAHRLQDRVVFKLELNQHSKTMRVVPFLFSRLVTTLAWSGRLLWRLRDRRPSELLMLQGNVEYKQPIRAKTGTHTSRQSTQANLNAP
ncbi:hypothetical protein PINS_up004382 [Pythium insidiosum]|nr:hypothetical protein PINS_up004382 [Pythium insidiosum]